MFEVKIGLVGKDGEDAAAGPLDKRKYQQILPDSSLIIHGTLLKTIGKSTNLILYTKSWIIRLKIVTLRITKLEPKQ